MMQRLALASLLAAALAGCGSKKTTASDHGGSADPKVAERAAARAARPAAPARKPITADFFGKKVAPPGALAKITVGQPVAEARKAAPELFPKPGDEYQLTDVEGVEGVSYAIAIDKKHAVDRMTLMIPAAARPLDLITAAWGKGTDAVDTIGKPRTYWFDPATGWRAYLEEGFGHDANLQLTRYLPVAALLGDGGDQLGFAPQGILGATIDELRTRFAGALVETDAATAAADQKKVSDLAGKDVSKVVGAAQPSVRVELPPTEWGNYWTRVEIDWGKDGKVEDVWFDLPYAAHPADKDTMRALFEKKWGAPKEAEKYGEKIWIYRAASPSVVVQDDDIAHGWNVRVSTRKAGK